MVAFTESGTISLFTAFLSAVAIVLVALIGRWQRQGREEATRERAALHDKQTELTEAIAPSNGHDTLGQALEAVENKLDAIDTRLVEGDERFGRIEESLNERGPRIDHLEDRSAETLALVAENHAMFKNYIEAWTPLAARAVGEWGVDGMKTEQTMKVTKKTKKKPKA